MTGNVAVGVKVFTRVGKLRTLLKSIDRTTIGTVYVADDGEMTEEKATLYDTDFDFDLTVLDLPYDAGLGRGRARIVERLSEEFLLVCDSDHELVSDVTVLRDQLKSDPSLGGVSGLLLEDGRVTGTCHDLHENSGVLVRTVKERKQTEKVAGHPLVPFEFLPNVAMFRRECLQDYCWDPEYVIGKEHLDFYVGHSRTTDWWFGVCPSVLFAHYPGGDRTYINNRESYEKLEESQAYFLEKWGYDQVLVGYTDWEDPNVHEPKWSHLGRDALKKLLLSAPPSVQKSLMRGRNCVRRWRNRPPL